MFGSAKPLLYSVLFSIFFFFFLYSIRPRPPVAECPHSRTSRVCLCVPFVPSFLFRFASATGYLLIYGPRPVCAANGRARLPDFRPQQVGRWIYLMRLIGDRSHLIYRDDLSGVNVKRSRRMCICCVATSECNQPYGRQMTTVLSCLLIEGNSNRYVDMCYIYLIY